VLTAYALPRRDSLRESADAPLARKGQECALLSINAPTRTILRSR
jgi:hypothetical protein